MTDLDDAIRLLRQAIFGLERRLDRGSLRQQVLRLCAGLSPVPEITFAGPVDDALLPAAAAQLVETLRVALVIGPQVTQTSLCLKAGENLRAVVIFGTGPWRPRDSSARAPAWDFSPLLDQASPAGIAIEIEPAQAGTQFAWSFPGQAHSPPPAAQRRGHLTASRPAGRAGMDEGPPSAGRRTTLPAALFRQPGVLDARGHPLVLEAPAPGCRRHAV